MLLRHIRAKTPLGAAMEILLRQYQLWAGTSQSILVDTTPLPWIPDKWITRIRRTLHKHDIKVHHEAWVICPIRYNDVFLMEAIQELGLTNAQLERLNACRMYLQVTTLVEIVDHMGKTLLPQILCKSNAQSPQGLDEISESILQWPSIHQPSRASWRFWMKTICNLFAGHPNSTALHHKLGDWTTHYQDTRIWKWKLTTTNSLLYRVSPHRPMRAAICMQTMRTQMKFSITVPTNQQFEGYPVTPYDDAHCTIFLPVPPIRNQVPLDQHHNYHETITAQFRATLQPWQRPLFGPIHCHQPTNTILKTNRNLGTLTLVSDASVQNSKQSGFAWVITHKATKLWRGVGIAPGPAEDIYSGRAEAFGLIAGLTFLKHYVDSYEPMNFQAAPLCCYCDNLGVITNVTDLLTTPSPQPNDTTADDWDVYATIAQLARECHPLELQVIHVKGHQDKDPKPVLTRVEQLNVECDCRAKTYTRATNIISTNLKNPAMPTAQPHLSIKGKIICRQLPRALRHATTFPRTKSFCKTNTIGKNLIWQSYTGTF